MIFTAPQHLHSKAVRRLLQIGWKSLFGGTQKSAKNNPPKNLKTPKNNGNKSFETKNDSNFLALRPTVMVKQCQVCPQKDLDLTISYHILPLFRSQKSQKSYVSNNRKNITSGPAKKKMFVMKPWISGD